MTPRRTDEWIQPISARPRIERRLTTRMACWFVVIALMCITAVVLLWNANRQLSHASSAGEEAAAITAAATRASALVVDAETGLRGYSIVHESRFLGPYRHAVAALPADLAELQRLTAGHPTDRARVTGLVHDATSYLDDYASPLVRRIDLAPDAGRRSSVLDAGKSRVDHIRSEVGHVVATVKSTDTARGRASAASTRAALYVRIGLAATVLVALFLAGVMVFLDRLVAVPIAKVGLAAKRLEGGDLAVRVDERRRDEVGQLGHDFNSMASAIQEGAAAFASQQQELEQANVALEARNVELEGQTVELGNQTVELEAQHAELSVGRQHLKLANAALQERSEQLEALSIELSLARDRAAFFAQVAERFSARPSVSDRADTLLISACELTGAAVGAVYGIASPADDRFHLLSRLGIGQERLAEEVLAGSGMAGRALAEGLPVQLARPDGDLVIDSFGVELPVLQELHVPLMRDGRPAGVLCLGKTELEPFAPASVDAVVHLADTAAVSIDNALETLRCRWLADLNRGVLDAAGDAIHLEGPDGETILSNAAMQRFRVDVLGIQGDPEQEDRDTVLGALAERTADPVAFRARLALAYDEPEFEGSDEYELRDTQRWIHRYTAPVHASDGSRIGRIFVMRETTVERQAEQAKDDLMSTISHELRTPLSAIVGFTELLLHREFDPAERNEYLETILEQSNRLAALIADFLDLQRLQHGEFRPEPRDVDLEAMARSEVLLFSAQSQRHTLSTRAVGPGLTVVGDPDRLRRATANLLSNAIKYSPEGGDVVVEVQRTGDSVTLSVTDHGIGIAAESIGRVFDRFYRVDNSSTRRIGGTGLGLALVRELVEDSGGTVGVESTEGSGSRFWFSVPAQVAVPAVGAAHAE